MPTSSFNVLLTVRMTVVVGKDVSAGEISVTIFERAPVTEAQEIALSAV